MHYTNDSARFDKFLLGSKVGTFETPVESRGKVPVGGLGLPEAESF